MCIYKAVTKTQREGGGKCILFLAVQCVMFFVTTSMQQKVNVSSLKHTWSLQLYHHKFHPLCEAPVSQYKNHWEGT